MTTEVVLFDLGGVLVELGGVGEFGALIGEPREEEIWRRWLGCPWVRRFERGQCTPQEFARGMVESWNLPLSPEAFLEGFRRWVKGLFPGARELVSGLAGRVRRACLSNTNALHADRQLGQLGLGALFDAHFLSHHIGLVKPDREAFEHTVAALACRPPSILFLDDNRINVDAAREVGLDAHVVKGVTEARTLLAARGLVPAY